MVPVLRLNGSVFASADTLAADGVADGAAVAKWTKRESSADAEKPVTLIGVKESPLELVS